MEARANGHHSVLYENPVIYFLHFASRRSVWAVPGIGEVMWQRGHNGSVSDEGDTSSGRRWDLCQISTDTPDSFYSWTEWCEHDTNLLSLLSGLLGDAGRLGTVLSAVRLQRISALKAPSYIDSVFLVCLRLLLLLYQIWIQVILILAAALSHQNLFM